MTYGIRWHVLPFPSLGFTGPSVKSNLRGEGMVGIFVDASAIACPSRRLGVSKGVSRCRWVAMEQSILGNVSGDLRALRWGIAKKNRIEVRRKEDHTEKLANLV